MMLRVIFFTVTLFVRGLEVRVTLTLAVVFLAIAFLGTVATFAAVGFITTTGVKAAGFLTLATAVEVAPFFGLPFGFAEEVAVAALALGVLEAGFLALGMGEIEK